MPGIGNVARLDSEPTYRELEKALSELLAWLSARTLAQAQEDLSGLGDRLRGLWALLKAAGATATLETWRSAHGLRGWANTSAEGLILKTANFAERVRGGKPTRKLAEGHARQLAAMLGPGSHFDETRWIDFREAVREYTEELLDRLRPESLPDGRTVSPLPPNLKPKWDGDNRTLIWLIPIKSYKKASADRQIDLLEAFEKAKWDRCIPYNDPLRLNQTLRDLNAGLPLGTIRFSADGSGGVRWDQAPPL
jgi:hypothetical protein